MCMIVKKRNNSWFMQMIYKIKLKNLNAIVGFIKVQDLKVKTEVLNMRW